MNVPAILQVQALFSGMPFLFANQNGNQNIKHNKKEQNPKLM